MWDAALWRASLFCMQPLAPSPYDSRATALIEASAVGAASVVDEVLGGYGDAISALGIRDIPLPLGGQTAALAEGGVTESCMDLPNGTAGRLNINVPRRISTGARIDIAFDECVVNGVTLRGALAVRISRYVSESDFAFVAAPDGLVATVAGRTVGGLSGALACDVLEAAPQCYVSHDGRGWSLNSTIQNDEANGRYMVGFAKGGLAEVQFAHFNTRSRAGSATVKGVNGQAIVTPLSAEGQFSVTFETNGSVTTYTIDHP